MAPTMDAALRRELEELRRRAFGPGAGIADDTAALARLEALEAAAREATGSSRDTGRPTAGSGRADDAHPPEVGSADPPPDDPPSSTRRASVPLPTSPEREGPEAPARRRRTLPMLVGAAAVVVIYGVWLGGSEASDPPAAAPAPKGGAAASLDGARYVYTADLHFEKIHKITLAGSFGQYIDLPIDGEAPTFPADRALRWVTPLGEYYGWDLWIAGGAGEPLDEHCLLLERDDEVHARCEAAREKTLGLLHVALSAADIAPEEIPQPMGEGDRIRFWWRRHGEIDVLLGSSD